MPIHILPGIIRDQKCVALITFMILVPVLWINVLIAKDTVALNSEVNRGLLLSLTRFGIIFPEMNPGDLFSVGVSLCRFLSIFILLLLLG